MEDVIILGGGLAGLSMASFLACNSIVLERQEKVGGLSRSYDLDGIAYDIGPHVIFSKNKEVLDLHTNMIEVNRVRRSNQILYKGSFIKYPFENDLGKLPSEDRDWCLKEFLNNPYENYSAKNMLQFFLKTFGEGITYTYLQPYNQKIWKFDPSCMDTQMVERIPKPPKEDVIKSAKGIETEGYTHQLYFHYPTSGGFQTLIDAYSNKAQERSKIRTNIEIKSIQKNNQWIVSTSHGDIVGRKLINCMPLHELFNYISAPIEIKSALNALLYNSIHVVVMNVKRDYIGEHFGIYVPDPNIIFHRISKLNFLGENYSRKDNSSTIMAEVTFRPDSYLGELNVKEIEKRVISDLEKLGLITAEDVVSVATRTEKYAYVIYDLDHRKNADTVLSWLRDQGIESVGRFAEFEYLNSDGVVERTLALAKKINEMKQ